MRNTAIFLAGVILLLFANAATACPQASGPAQGQTQGRGPSTPEERKRFVNVAHKVIKSPLDDSLKSEVKWALKWIEDIPDINVTPCSAPLGDLVSSGNRYAARIFSIYVLAMGLFLIEQPGKSSDPVAQYLAGVEGALKAYKAVLRGDPEASSEDLDDLLQRQSAGKLEEFVRSAAKECGNSTGS